jgi:hypothetical protein
MNLPNQLTEREAIDPKLAIGSSLKKPKELLSIIFLLYAISEEKDSIEYGIESENKIKIKPELIEKIRFYFSELDVFNQEEFDKAIEDSPITEMAIEPLQVTLQVYWKISKVKIIGSNSSSQERSHQRYPKLLSFTTNMDILMSMLTDDSNDITPNSKALIYCWLVNKTTPTPISRLEDKLKKTLLIFTEETLFQVWEDETPLIFQQEGIYNVIDDEGKIINHRGNDSKERKGTMRNLWAVINKNVNPFLKISSNKDELEFNSNSSFDFFSNYRKRVSNYLDLNPKSVEIKTVEAEDEVNSNAGLNKNQVIIDDKKLRTIIFEAFKYVKNTFIESNVINGYELKDSTIESRVYKGLTLSKYFKSEILIGLFTEEQTPDNLKSSNTIRFIDEKIKTLNFENSYFTSQWNESDGRGLSLGNFNKYLTDVSNNSLEIIKKEDKTFQLIKKGSSSDNSHNKIYYGTPGTGKSHRADIETNGEEVQKVTFHPDYDYHSFVGGYKPTMVGDKIAYKFVPQIFTKIYIDTWKNLVSTDETQPFYLQIEEINRGNCAEIFGDLFQLLDRNSDGLSKYEVTAEEELRKHLEGDCGFNSNKHEGIKDGKLRFPSNLKIIATMNTSDQSLFPMDSAFKRRWDWIYVPIDYNCSSSNFTIQLNNGKSFEWLSFLKIINEEIFEITKSQDKQIGNWFIDAQNSEKVISESTFVNKVIFYLWNDVFKDEENTIFKTTDGKNLTYTSFFENGTSNNIVSYILEERLKLTDLNKAETTTTGEE